MVFLAAASVGLLALISPFSVNENLSSQPGRRGDTNSASSVASGHAPFLCAPYGNAGALGAGTHASILEKEASSPFMQWTCAFGCSIWQLPSSIRRPV